ncbi:hypothetical protein BC829DRAFT_179140 [Chytridium lagenaria]|nr:hypothetical protein BC829DRAFT_179140 [Chytridium lagenaria]
MESLGVWKMLIGPLFYDHPTPFKYLRDDVLDIFVLASALPELPNVGAISTLITVVSAKARKDNGDLWATEDRLAACTALKQIVTSASEVSVNSLRRAGCLDVFFPIAFDEKEATEGAELELRELCLDLLTSLTKAGPETAIFIAADKGFRQNLLKSYTEHLGTNSFEKVRFLLYHVTMQLLSLPGSGIPTSKNEEYMAPLSIDTKAPKNQLSTEWMSNVLGLFPSAIDSRRSLDLQNNLLNLLRELMRSSPPGSVNRRRIRHALISGRVFEHLLSILSVSITPWEGMTEAEAEVAYHDLCSIVFSTIGIVITGSDFARKTFRDLQGYDEIRARILKKGHHSGWSGLLESFFGLLVPRWMPASPTQPSNIPVVIRNPDVLHALVALFAEVAHDIQLDLLEKLEFLAKGHEMNRVIMSQVGLGMLLLKKVLPHCKTEELVAKCINVFETIANYSITVAEAKALLRLLRHIDPSSEKTTSAGPVSQSEPQQLSRASSSSSLQTPRMSRRASGSLLERKHMGGSQNYLPPFYDSLLKCVPKAFAKKRSRSRFLLFFWKKQRDCSSKSGEMAFEFRRLFLLYLDQDRRRN